MKELATRRASHIELGAAEGEVDEGDLASVDQWCGGQCLQPVHDALSFSHHH